MDQYRQKPQFAMPFEDLIIDSFAGGGGASTGIEQALGRPVDIAINHDPDSITMHKVNHPTTKHYCENVWDIDPRKLADGRPVALAWFSPDCKHFSKAKGGKPVDKNIRGLAWLAVRYAATIKPRIIALENVEEFLTWGPLIDGRPCKKRKGQTFNSFANALRRLGYVVDWKMLRASDFGVPTIRKRFFLIARCDGQPIVWPKPTHGNPALPGFKKSGLKKWKTAADIIDWSIPCPSIFGRKKPLADNTLARIAKGIDKFVINNPKPFIVRIGQQGFGGNGMQYSVDQPLTTVTSKAEHCLVAPLVVKPNHTAAYYKCFRGQSAEEPLKTITSSPGFALCTAFLAKHFGGNYQGAGADLREPLSTVTATDHNALVAAHLVHFRNNSSARPLTDPLPTLTAGGGHVAEVRAFLIKYYSEGGQWQDMREPLHTVSTKPRLGLVTIHGEEYQIVDIGMRMLEPHELFAAHGFPPDYIIDRDSEGNKIPKYKQVARCGNSVPPELARVIVAANYNSAAENTQAA